MKVYFLIFRDPDYQADKWVHHFAKYEYKVDMEFLDPNEKKLPEYVTSPGSPDSPVPQSPHTPPAQEEDSSDSSSDDD